MALNLRTNCFGSTIKENIQMDINAGKALLLQSQGNPIGVYYVHGNIKQLKKCIAARLEHRDHWAFQNIGIIRKLFWNPEAVIVWIHKEDIKGMDYKLILCNDDLITNIKGKDRFNVWWHLKDQFQKNKH